MDFTVLDWVILFGYLMLVFYFGILGRKYIRDSVDFIVASRSMGLHTGVISLVATEIGIITLMYYSEMGFLFGFTAFLAGVIPAVMYFVVGRTGFVIRKFRELELVTIPQFFEDRYGRDVRILGGALMAIGGALNFGVFPIIEARFLNIVTGIPQVYLVWTMAFLMGLVLLYTALGGMVSVIITNYIQFAVMVAGMAIVTVYCIGTTGLSQTVQTVAGQIGSSGFDPFAHPAFGWKFIVWQCLNWLAIICAWAPVAARTFASESPSVVKKTFSLTGFYFLGRAIIPVFWGIAALAYFRGQEKVGIEATPELLREILPMGLLGLVVAGMLAASMSTYSGYMLAWSSIISQDVILPLVRRPLSPRFRLLLNQGTVLALTLFIMVWGLFYVIPGATYFYLQITANLFVCGAFWAIVGGLYWKKAHRLGAVCSMVLGGSATFLYFVVPDPVEWTGAIGILSYIAAFFGMTVGSLFARAQSSLARGGMLLGIGLIVAFAWLVVYGPESNAVWGHVWVAVLAISFTLFIALSVYALFKSYGEIRTMLRRLAGARDELDS